MVVPAVSSAGDCVDGAVGKRRDCAFVDPDVVAHPRRLCVDRRSHHREPRHLLRPHGRRSARVQVEISRTAVSQRRPHRPRPAAAECRHPVSVGQRCGAISRPEGSVVVGGARPGMARPQPRMARRARPRAVHPRRVVGRAGVPQPIREHQRHRQTRLAAEIRNRRVVRIFDPSDRAKYDRGENVATEYLWPLRAP